MDPKAFLEFMHTAERLKDTTRHCTTTNRRTESVAEHCWRVALMAMLLKHVFPEADMQKVIQMCLIHDLGECFTGDIPTFQKTDADRQEEDTLLMNWIRRQPTEIADVLAGLFCELHAAETTEAKICKALDQIEAVIQHNESPISTWSENEFELNQIHAFRSAAFSEWLTALRQCVLEETLDKIANNKE